MKNSMQHFILTHSFQKLYYTIFLFLFLLHKNISHIFKSSNDIFLFNIYLSFVRSASQPMIWCLSCRTGAFKILHQYKVSISGSIVICVNKKKKLLKAPINLIVNFEDRFCSFVARFFSIGDRFTEKKTDSSRSTNK